MRTPTRALVAACLVAGALPGCKETRLEELPPTDRLYFPIGVATTHVSGGATALLAASSNFDLRYAASDGGTILSIDPVASKDAGPLTLRGAARIGSYAGPVAVADAATCPAFPARPVVALVASRYDDLVYQLDVGADGALSCGAGCVRGPAYARLKDPFAVAVTCGGGLRRGFVAYIDPPYIDTAQGFSGWISEWDLDDPGAPGRDVDLGDGPVRALAWEPAADRLWATTLSSGPRALLYAIALTDPRWSGASPVEAVQAIDLFPDVRGIELRSVAVGTPPAPGVARLFLTAVTYDADAQAASGRRGGAIGGVLMVVDVVEGIGGQLGHSLRAVTPLAVGAGDVQVVRRAGGLPDLAIATATDQGLVMLYDDATGSASWVMTRDAVGGFVAGDRPVAVAVDQAAPGAVADVYVAAFGSNFVTHFAVDPSNPSPLPALDRIGGLAP
jgi:hypothetical protein